MGFVFSGIDHLDSIPGAAFQEGAFGALGGAFAAADAFERIHLDDPEAGGSRVLYEDHAFIYRTIGLADGSARTASAGFGDVSQDLGLFFAPFCLSRRHVFPVSEELHIRSDPPWANILTGILTIQHGPD